MLRTRARLPKTIVLLPLLLSSLAAAGERPDDPPRPAAPPAPPRSARPAASAGPAGLPTIAAKTTGLERRDGLLDTWLDRRQARIWIALPPPVTTGSEMIELIHVEGLVTGLGSNPVGLDRGQSGDARRVRFRRVGNRVLLEEPNTRFRTVAAGAAEARAARESFATSVLWGGEVAAEDPGGRVLVDFTSFLVRDAHGVAARLKEAEQGSFALDESRSALDLDACLSFPDNLEFEAVLTYASAEPGPLVRETAPSAQAITLVQRQSLVRPPPPGYRPRRFDPRAGSFALRFADLAAPLERPIDTAYVVRFRLEKTDPAAERSAVKKPIVFYVDPGAPEPIRSALVEGASWWKQAFEQAGFIDAYRVELLPPGIHPLDLRYNVIQWVHRSTRGWAYGSAIVDPLTGEVLNGHVTLDALRARHDRLLFDGLCGTAATGTGAPDDPLRLALDRIRQLAAHEVGHTLGLAHNFAASTYGRASVMDYPAPLIGLADGGGLDFSQAYSRGIGSWDMQAIRHAYLEVAPGDDEDDALAAIVAEGIGRGLVFLSDDDARPAGAAQPRASLWDNGDDPVVALEQAMAVRAAALARFGTRNLRPGDPLGALEEVLAPVYFHHRYQLKAAAKVIGGLDYRYALRGDGQDAATPIDPARQERAIAAVAGLLDPAALDLPEGLLRLLAPPPLEHPARERFATATAPAFDALGAAATAADLVVDALLQPERAARLVDFHRRDPAAPGIEDVLDALLGRAFAPRHAPAVEPPRTVELRRVIQDVAVRGLLELAGDARTTPGVRSRVEARLARLEAELAAGAPSGATAGAHRRHLAGEIHRWLTRPHVSVPPPAAAPAAPPGDPIGAMLDDDGCGFAIPGQARQR